MSGLLKAGGLDAGTRVQPFLGQQARPNAGGAPGLDDEELGGELPARSLTAESQARDGLLVRMEAETYQLQCELEELATLSEARETEAYQKGVHDGSRQTAEETARRDAILKDALAAAASSVADQQQAIEIIALQLAKAALTRVLGDGQRRDELLSQAIAWQLQRLAASKPSTLRLSKADFPDESSVAELAGQWPDLAVRIDRELATGECRLALEMGEVEIGLPGQIERLGALFDSWSEERETIGRPVVPNATGRRSPV